MYLRMRNCGAKYAMSMYRKKLGIYLAPLQGRKNNEQKGAISWIIGQVVKNVHTADHVYALGNSSR